MYFRHKLSLITLQKAAAELVVHCRQDRFRIVSYHITSSPPLLDIIIRWPKFE